MAGTTAAGRWVGWSAQAPSNGDRGVRRLCATALTDRSFGPLSARSEAAHPVVGSAESRMRYRILGPLQVTNGARELAIGRGRQRALFAYLLLHANEVVSRDRLVDELWSENAPASAAAMVHNHVSSLRKAFAAAGHAALETHGHGYRLRVEPGELDADEFERLVARGPRGARRPGARRRRRGCCARGWRSGAAAPSPISRWRSSRKPRSPGWRMSGSRRWRIASRPSSSWAGRRRISSASSRASWRDIRCANGFEPPAMLALYRCGRQTDALAVFDDARHTLVDTLGLGARSGLQQLQRRVLEHDPALAPPGAEQSRRPPRPGITSAPG